MATTANVLGYAPSSPTANKQKGGAAPVNNADLNNVNKLIVRDQAQRIVLNYALACLDNRKRFTEIQSKFDAIDLAYARYKGSKETKRMVDGVDIAADTPCDVFADDDITPPIVVSQVDSHIAYLAEVFLSGVPLFPVVSTPSNRTDAEQLEALVDDHAMLGAYPRHLLKFLRDCGKYNFGACEAFWDAIDQFSVLDDVSNASGQKMGRKAKKFTRVKHLNVRNVVWDWTVPVGDISEHGDYAGYIEKMTRTRLKRLLNKYGAEGKLYNADKALASSTTVNTDTPNYRENPQVSEYITGQQAKSTVNWDAYFDPAANNGRRGPSNNGAMYEVFFLYARIMPADFGISAPARNTPQIWKFVIVNGQFMVFADRVISAYDYLPILFGSPLEDSMDYQTQSVAEGEIPFQKAAATLFNIRFAAARRAVSDRALYLPDMIKPTDINNPTAAPKIPVSISQLSSKTIRDAYFQIPFDMRGTESTIQDAATIVSFSKDLHGINNPRQGAFQKGNKSVKEWDDTMSGSDGRMRLPAIVLEHQFFSPLKSIIALNIFQYGDDAKVVSQATGNTLEINIAQLRSKVLSFRMADGFTPKSKIASTDVILAGMQMIGSSPILQQAYGARMPGMFAHFMTLSGVKGFDQYDPSVNPLNANEQLTQNQLQPPITPTQPGQVIPAQVVPKGTIVPNTGPAGTMPAGVVPTGPVNNVP